MSLLLVTVNALVPIVFVILLGILAGRIGLIKPESSSVLSSLALNFCLPALLFYTTASMSLAELQDWGFLLGITLGMLSIYLLALVLSLTIFHQPTAASSLQALSSAFPSVALVGIPVLTAVIGASAVLSAVYGQLIGSLVLVPLTLTLLEAGSQTQEGHKGGAVVWSSLLRAIKQPLVWAPLAGIFMVVAQIPIPDVAQNSFSLIGEAASGVALFSTGLLLSGQKLRVDSAVSLNVALKLLAQPAVMWLLALLFGVTGQHFREMILLGALPTAVTPSILAVQYKVNIDESDATIFLTTVLSIVTLGVIIALTG